MYSTRPTSGDRTGVPDLMTEPLVMTVLISGVLGQMLRPPGILKVDLGDLSQCNN